MKSPLEANNAPRPEDKFHLGFEEVIKVKEIEIAKIEKYVSYLEENLATLENKRSIELAKLLDLENNLSIREESNQKDIDINQEMTEINITISKIIEEIDTTKKVATDNKNKITKLENEITEAKKEMESVNNISKN